MNEPLPETMDHRSTTTHDVTGGGAWPPPLMTSEPGSFAEKTIRERKPQIIAGVLADNSYPAEIRDNLLGFRDEIVTGKAIQPLRETAGDTSFWNDQWARYKGRSWFNLPWYFAETYFYRRLLEAVHYFSPGPWHARDPFAAQKRAQEQRAITQLSKVWTGIDARREEARFLALLHGALWGNRADLSNFTVRERAIGEAPVDHKNILIDDTESVLTLLQHRTEHIAFINDNVGADSLFDLALADHLLQVGWAHQVTFHLKNQPFFVSDAMPQDVRYIIIALRESESQGLAALGERLNTALTSGALVLTTHPFWTQCLGFREMPKPLHAQLQRADLVVLKGDVNYRRLLDDRHWSPTTTPLQAITDYFPHPFLVLRTLKGEIIAGLAPGQAEATEAEDPDWLTNGKRGIIQLVT